MTSICTDDVRGSIEQQLTTKEYNLKHKRKASKTKPKKDGDENAAVEGTADPFLVEDDDVWSIPSEDEARAAPSGSGKAKKAKTDGGAQAAAREAAKQARIRQSKWRQEVAKAAKLINSLNSVCHSVGQMMIKVGKNGDKINGALQESLKQADDMVRAMRDCALFANVYLAY